MKIDALILWTNSCHAIEGSHLAKIKSKFCEKNYTYSCHSIFSEEGVSLSLISPNIV